MNGFCAAACCTHALHTHAVQTLVQRLQSLMTYNPHKNPQQRCSSVPYLGQRGSDGADHELFEHLLGDGARDQVAYVQLLAVGIGQRSDRRPGLLHQNGHAGVELLLPTQARLCSGHSNGQLYQTSSWQLSTRPHKQLATINPVTPTASACPQQDDGTAPPPVFVRSSGGSEGSMTAAPGPRIAIIGST